MVRHPTFAVEDALLKSYYWRSNTGRSINSEHINSLSLTYEV